MKKISTVLLAVLCGLLLVSCGVSTANSGEKKTISVYIGNNLFESSCDPIKGFMCHGYPFINEALIQVDTDSKYVGDLADSWTVSTDGLTYTFTLKEGIKFSDGSEFTSDDVAFTYNTVKANQELNEEVDLTKLSSVDCPDAKTVVFSLSEPYSPFLDVTSALQIVPSDAYDSELFDTMPIGTGAYKIAQYDPNSQIILVKNENYYGETPDIDQVNIVAMNADSAFAAASTGQLDVVMVSSVYTTEEVPNMSLKKLETMDVRNISLPVLPEQTMQGEDGQDQLVGNNVTCDIAVRKALAIGINRQEIINDAFKGEGRASVTFTDNLVWSADASYEDSRVDEAGQILTDAGWVDSDGDGIREKDGKRCSFDLIAPGGDEDRYRLAVAVAKSAADLGIEINVRNASWDVAVDEENRTPIVWGWGQFSPTVVYQIYYSDMFLDHQYANVSGYSNPECDAAIEKAIAATDVDSANAAWKQALEIGYQDYPYLYIVNIEHSYFVKDNLDISVDTQVAHPHGHGSPVICNLKDWKLK